MSEAIVELHKRRHPTVHEIQWAVCEQYGVRAIEMVSDRRAISVARPRQVAMYLARELTTHSLPAIGRFFGNREHTTVMHAIKVITSLCAADPAFRESVGSCRERLHYVEGNR